MKHNIPPFPFSLYQNHKSSANRTPPVHSCPSGKSAASMWFFSRTLRMVASALWKIFGVHSINFQYFEIITNRCATDKKSCQNCVLYKIHQATRIWNWFTGRFLRRGAFYKRLCPSFLLSVCPSVTFWNITLFVWENLTFLSDIFSQIKLSGRFFYT